MRRRASRAGRGVSPIIATLFLVGITITAGLVLWSFRPVLPPKPTQLDYSVLTNPQSPQWDDGSDCKTVNNTEVCQTLPALDIVFTEQTPPVVPVSALYFYFLCNGSVYLGAPLASMQIVPGSTKALASNAPQLGACGTYVPPKAAFNRLAYFDPLVPDASYLSPGDQIFVTSHTFQPPDCPNPGPNGQCDDDFHGTPAWCYTVPSACSIVIYWSAGGSLGLSSSVLRIPLYGLSA